ncbi:hypothetical protein [Nocardioides zeicaulis]|uniref:Uncharacterized protein n=1 Tax=Nocardioides zeicaulis TaxID=1776857 RepID=A0ABV6E5Q6_9ACTN
MSWEHELFALFDDLEGQAAALWEAEREAELADRARAEYASVSLASRLMASRGRDVQLGLPHVGRVEGRLDRVGDGWCLLSGAGQDWIVPLAHLVTVEGCGERSVPEVAWSPVDRLGLRAALRRLAETGARCVLHLADGSWRAGRLERAGADFVECVPDDEAHGEPVLVAHAALVAVQSREG